MDRRNYNKTIEDIEKDVLKKLKEEEAAPTEFVGDDLPHSDFGEDYFD